jgi:hypothetical protein
MPLIPSGELVLYLFSPQALIESHAGLLPLVLIYLILLSVAIASILAILRFWLVWNLWFQLSAIRSMQATLTS